MPDNFTNKRWSHLAFGCGLTLAVMIGYFLGTRREAYEKVS